MRTTRTRQDDGVTISDFFAATGHGSEEDENLTKHTTAQDDQENETEKSLSEFLQTLRQISRIHENMGHPSNRSWCSRIFADEVESDGNRLEVTPLEAPWRTGGKITTR